MNVNVSVSANVSVSQRKCVWIIDGVFSLVSLIG